MNKPEPSPSKHSTRQRVAWFLIVGATAAAVHWGVVVGLVSAQGLKPLLANVVGWLVAFVFSFLGHYHLTFRDQEAPLARSGLRFLGVSAMGFAINQSLYAAGLALGQPFDWALICVLLMVAVLTYFLSRRWAFMRL